jgi:hypothetical protein
MENTPGPKSFSKKTNKEHRRTNKEISKKHEKASPYGLKMLYR